MSLPSHTAIRERPCHLILSAQKGMEWRHIFSEVFDSRVVVNLALLQKKKILGCFYQHPGGRLMPVVHSSWAGRGNWQRWSGSSQVLSQAFIACIQISLDPRACPGSSFSLAALILALPMFCISIPPWWSGLHHHHGEPVYPLLCPH